VEITSPDGAHTVIIAEDVYPFSIYGGDVFERTGAFSMKKLTKYETDIDYHYPFSQETYGIEWKDDGLVLHYDYDGRGNYRTVKIEYYKSK
jgi:hypothetical protein